MICYRLRCGSGHDFEGWFKTGADFDRQSSEGLVACPTCSSTAIARALMAPAVVGSGKHRRRSQPTGPEIEGEVIPPSRPLAADAGGDIPAALRALLSRVREEVERTCDNVGGDFADQAIRMHRGELDRRGIYGETTEVEREILADEGVEVARIPWIKRADS